MNNRVFELQQDLIKSQDSFKDVILSESDVEKHIDIINRFSKEEINLTDEINKEFEKAIKERKKENTDDVIDVVEDQEDSNNTNDKHPLLGTFRKLVEKGTSPKDIVKQFKEDELLEIGKEYGFEWGNKGTKIEKVNLLIEAMNK